MFNFLTFQEAVFIVVILMFVVLFLEIIKYYYLLKEVQKEEIDLTNRNLTEMRLKVLKNK